jgi:hypothetical protein
MPNSDLDIIKDNVPEASIEEIERVFIKNSNDIMKTICELSGIIEEEKQKTEWEIRRDICDARSVEIQKILNNARKENTDVNIQLEKPLIRSNPYEGNIVKPEIETISTFSYSNITINQNI